MPSELWEIVRADELKVGDEILTTHGPGSFIASEMIRTIYDSSPAIVTLNVIRDLRRNEPVFRRHAGHHPDVLMRVIENMHSEIRGWNEVGDYPSPTDSIDKYIAEAEAEIAKERES